MRQWRWVPGLVLMTFLAVPFACNSSSSTEDDCVSLCNDGLDCPTGTFRAFETCEEGCSLLGSIVEDGNCEDAYEQFLSCASGQPDICNLEDTCTTELGSYANCFLAFCEDNEARCDEITCTFGVSGSASCTITAHCGNGPQFEMTCDETAGECTCATDDEVTSTVAYDAAFCDGAFDDQIGAATTACGWD